MGVGELIQAAREQKNLSRPKLAELLGVKPNTVWRWENDERQPSDDDKRRLAQILGVSIAYLMGEDPAPPKPQKHVDQNGLPSRRINTVKIPLLSRAAVACCGPGNDLCGVAMEAEGMLDVPETMLGWARDDLRPPFAMQTDGDSMEFSGIAEGSIIVVNPAEDVPTGKIGLVCIGGSTLMVKRLQWRRDGGVDLFSDGPTSANLSFSREDLETEWLRIVGRVTGAHLPL